MNKKKQIVNVVRYWWKRSEDSIKSAEREINARDFRFAINRLYYLLFYAVSAALLERNQDFKKHSGVRSAFHREFVKKNLLDKKLGKLYDQLFENRQEGDYIALLDFDELYVKEKLNNCKIFLDKLRSLIKSLK